MVHMTAEPGKALDFEEQVYREERLRQREILDVLKLVGTGVDEDVIKSSCRRWGDGHLGGLVGWE
jgi:hypothetical protein